MSHSKEMLPCYLARASQAYVTQTSINMVEELAVTELLWGNKIPAICNITGVFIRQREINEGISCVCACTCV